MTHEYHDDYYVLLCPPDGPFTAVRSRFGDFIEPGEWMAFINYPLNFASPWNKENVSGYDWDAGNDLTDRFKFVGVRPWPGQLGRWVESHQ